MATRFELVREGDDQFYFQLRMSDGDIVLKGLASNSKVMTQNEILHVRNCLRDDSRMVPHEDAQGQQFVVVKDRDGSVLARSAKVATVDALHELEHKMIAAASAPIIDLARKSRSAS
ncbi:MAG: hypothetical protein AB8H80_15560 [Planctomycetota bacterium]